LVSAVGFMIVGVIFFFMPFMGKVVSYGWVQNLNSFLPNILHINILHVIILMAFIVGIGMSFVFVPSNSTIQIETNEEMRGRMYGLLNSLIGAVSFLPVILVGGLADLFSVGTVIGGVGIILIAVSIYYLFFIEFNQNKLKIVN